MTSPKASIVAQNVAAGVLEVAVQVSAYPMVGQHWREQLTGSNKAKWGRIFIDPDKSAKRERRAMALAPFAGLYRGEVGNNNDECPGAMFIWETQETSHVQPVDAYSNQAFGRDLYRALKEAVLEATVRWQPCPLHERMAWWEVRFTFF